MEEPILVYNLAGGFLIFIIAFHDIISAATDFTLHIVGTFFAGFRIDDLHFTFGSSKPTVVAFTSANYGYAWRSSPGGFGKAVNNNNIFTVHFSSPCSYRIDRTQ